MRGLSFSSLREVCFDNGKVGVLLRASAGRAIYSRLFDTIDTLESTNWTTAVAAPKALIGSMS